MKVAGAERHRRGMSSRTARTLARPARSVSRQTAHLCGPTRKEPGLKASRILACAVTPASASVPNDVTTVPPKRGRNRTSKRFRRFVTAAVVLTVAGTGTALGAAPRNYTTCDQTWAWGSRVCLDWTTGYGPVMYIYSDSRTLVRAFGVNVDRVMPQVRGTSWVNFDNSFFLQVDASGTYARTLTLNDGADMFMATSFPAGFAWWNNPIVVRPEDMPFIQWMANLPRAEFVVAK